MPVVSRIRRTSLALLAIGAVFALPAAGASSGSIGSVSHASLWQALGGKVRCGLALGTPSRLLCSSRAIPAPKGSNPMEGDPGFVFLGTSRRPTVARLSQNTWVGAESFPLHQVFVPLGSGRRWSTRNRRITCAIRRRSIRCTNDAGHGFTLTRSSYRAF